MKTNKSVKSENRPLYQVLLYQLPTDDPSPAWNNMTNSLAAGNLTAAISSFYRGSSLDYQQAYLLLGTNTVLQTISQIGQITPVFINNERAEYYFEATIDGEFLIFPIEFVRENGVWKIEEF